MANLSGDEIRNREDKHNHSPEQNKTIEQGRDVEPEAQKWSDKKGNDSK
ncbi:hypothetical protein [Paenibacillus tarimensis]|nr:hypothetical protein [Paenibacillus tarimensis]MCF2945847.1 hypothetical protein [Paenibacillus tarimensis]